MQISTAVEQALDRLSTETKERTMPKSIQTPIKPKFAEVWAQWLRIELCGDPELEKMAVACGEWCKAFSSRLEPPKAFFFCSFVLMPQRKPPPDYDFIFFYL